MEADWHFPFRDESECTAFEHSNGCGPFFPPSNSSAWSVSNRHLTNLGKTIQCFLYPWWCSSTLGPSWTIKRSLLSIQMVDNGKYIIHGMSAALIVLVDRWKGLWHQRIGLEGTGQRVHDSEMMKTFHVVNMNCQLCCPERGPRGRPYIVPTLLLMKLHQPALDSLILVAASGIWILPLVLSDGGWLPWSHISTALGMISSSPWHNSKSHK